MGILAPVLTIAQHKWGVLNQFELAKGAQGAGQVAIGIQLASWFPIQLDQNGHPRAPDGTLGLPRETKRIGLGLPSEQKCKNAGVRFFPCDHLFEKSSRARGKTFFLLLCGTL